MFKKLRKTKKLTQLELAVLIKISKQAISQYETGKRTPKLETMQKLADALEVDLDTIVKCFINDKKDQSKNTGTN